MMNFTIIENDIMDNDISDGAFRLYSILKSYCFGDKTTCFPSEATLANRMKKSVRTIQRYISSHKKKRRGSISNIYEILRNTMENKVKDLKNKFQNNPTTKKNDSAAEKSDSVSKKGDYSTYGTKKPKGIFNDSEQRNYSFTNLEAMLLGRDGVTFEDSLVND